MILFPAIDIKDGKVVRLVQGRFDNVTEYAYDPMRAAKHWKALGAKWLHIVDLDGARTGEMHNIDIIKKIAKEIGIPIQVGGGIRTKEVADDLLLHNVSRIVLGTKAIDDQDFLKKVLHSWKPDQVAVSIDCVKDHIMKDGWEKAASFSTQEFIRELENVGLHYLIYTDVAKDGMLSGPNLERIKGILDFTQGSKLKVIASGGVGDIKDIHDLCAINKQYNGRLVGAILGKALYEGKVDIEKALEVCSISA